MILIAGLLCFAARAAFAVGPFADVSRLATFLRARHAPVLEGSVTRADGQGQDASFFALAASFPVQSAFLVGIEIPYITLSVEEGIEDGFGDAIVRAKARAWKGRGRTLFFTSSLRLGSGSATLFPYSTASTDVELGVAFVDSVGPRDEQNALEPLRSLSYWVAAGGVYAARINDRLKEMEMHDSYATVGGGILVALSRRLVLELGSLGMFFHSGAVREVYASQVYAALSSAMTLGVGVQGERGDWRERAVDASVTVAVTVSY